MLWLRRQKIALLRQLKIDSYTAWDLQGRLARTLCEQGKFAEAESVMRQAVAEFSRTGLKDEALWERSGMARVSDFLVNTLDQQERIRLKLLNPLGVGRHRPGAAPRRRGAKRLRALLALADLALEQYVGPVVQPAVTASQRTPFELPPRG